MDAEMVRGREVLEVGAQDVNGSVRPHVESLGPSRYIGVDISPGAGVDEVLDASDLLAHFGPASFDVVVTTEMLEHVRDWRTVVHNLKGVLRPGGVLLVTTRSIGFPYHGYPFDFWRYQPEDARSIFSDLDILELETDTDAPGIFVLARQRQPPSSSTPNVALFSMITGRRTRQVSELQIQVFNVRHRLAPIAARLGSVLRPSLVQIRRTLRRRVVLPVWNRLPGTVRLQVRRLVGRA